MRPATPCRRGGKFEFEDFLAIVAVLLRQVDKFVK